MKTLVVRAVVVVGAYVTTALAVLLVVVVLRHAVSPVALRDVLGFYFISALASGLEPATVKASVLRNGSPPDNLGGVLGASAIKALAVSPILGVIWRFADPGAPFAVVLLLPLVVVAGFWATDVRVLLDLRGRHAWAVWLKQGSLAGGFVLLAALTGVGLSLCWAVLVSSLARLIPLAAIAMANGRGGGRGLVALKLLRDRRWVELAAVSAIAAAGGSIDRILALRYLPAASYGGYFLLYELFSRFWLIPYLITPVLFASLAAGRSSRALMARAWRLTLAAGAAFVVVVAVVAVASPAITLPLLGLPFGAPVIAFAAAVGVAALTQLRIAELQGLGAARRTLVVTALGALVSAVVFFIGVRSMGIDGLLWAWLVKSLVELVAAMSGGPRERNA